MMLFTPLCFAKNATQGHVSFVRVDLRIVRDAQWSQVPVLVGLKKKRSVGERHGSRFDEQDKHTDGRMSKPIFEDDGSQHKTCLDKVIDGKNALHGMGERRLLATHVHEIEVP